MFVLLTRRCLLKYFLIAGIDVFDGPFFRMLPFLPVKNHAVGTPSSKMTVFGMRNFMAWEYLDLLQRK